MLLSIVIVGLAAPLSCFLQSLQERCLYPENPLPDIPQALAQSVAPHPDVLNQGGPAMDRIKALFPLKPLPRKRRAGGPIFAETE